MTSILRDDQGERFKSYKKKNLRSLNLAITTDLKTKNKAQSSISLFSLSPYALNQNASVKFLDNQRIIKKHTPVRNNTFMRKEQSSITCSECKHNLNSSVTISPNSTFFKSNTGEILSFKLNSMLKSVKESNTEEKIKIIQSVFNEVIEKDKDFEIILGRIKSEYNNYIQMQALEIQKYVKTVKENEKIKSLMSDELERLFKENNEISVKYKELRVKYTEIYDKFLKIADIDLDTIDQSEDN